MTDDSLKRFSELSFTDFQALAQDPELSKYEKIGFPDSYREGQEKIIFDDIIRKLPPLAEKGALVLDIGPGCSDLPNLLIECCRIQEHRLLLADSAEMLELLPDESFVDKYPGRYPESFTNFDSLNGKLDVVIVYSVLQYVFAEGNIFDFLDKTLSLLSPGGYLLIGDIPNVSKRKRFFSSEAGVAFHQEYTGSLELPVVENFNIEAGNIDDSVLLGLLTRARYQGFDAYVVPQAKSLPMSNRREDILIVRP